MSNIVSKCEIECGVCPWGPYPRKGMTPEEFEQFTEVTPDMFQNVDSDTDTVRKLKEMGEKLGERVK